MTSRTSSTPLPPEPTPALHSPNLCLILLLILLPAFATATRRAASPAAQPAQTKHFIPQAAHQNEPISNPQPDDSINGTNPFPDAA